MELLLRRTAVDVVPFEAAQSSLTVSAWLRFGKGRHPAGLNLGDCYSYALARHLDAPLMFKGRDFSQTDIPSVL